MPATTEPGARASGRPSPKRRGGSRLSGTPFRSDTNPIPFVRYALDEAVPDFEYDYGAALDESGVVRHVEFPALNGEMEWIDRDGGVRRASFDDALDPSLAAQRLRTALSPDGEWLPTVVDAAHRRLLDVRRRIPDAGALAIATDQEHARAIGELLTQRHGVTPVVATSDDADASDRIERFARSQEPWLVAVRMVSEGVDIPRLCVGVYATTTSTELFFRQAVGRLIRSRPTDDDLTAWMYIPNDPRLRARAAEITRARRHHLASASRRQSFPAAPPAGNDQQMSLFAPLSATPLGALSAPSPTEGRPVERPAHDAVDPSLVLELPPLPRPIVETAGTTLSSVADRRARKERLRSLNAARAADLVRHANLSYASVNAELNRLAGIDRVTQASEADLERRLIAAERWLRR